MFLRLCLFVLKVQPGLKGLSIIKKVFLKTSQNSQENTCARASFWIRCFHRCFPVNFAKYLRTSFLQNISRRLFLGIIMRWLIFKFPNPYQVLRLHNFLHCLWPGKLRLPVQIRRIQNYLNVTWSSQSFTLQCFSLTHFMPLLSFYTPGFLMFSGV